MEVSLKLLLQDGRHNLSHSFSETNGVSREEGREEEREVSSCIEWRPFSLVTAQSMQHRNWYQIELISDCLVIPIMDLKMRISY